MKRYPRRLLAALLAAALTWSLLPAALAAPAPTLDYTPLSGGRTTLSVGGVTEKVYAVQVTMTLENYSEISFTAPDENVYVTEKTDGSALTLYIVNGQRPLNPGSALTLGTLTVTPAEGKTFAMPASAALKLLDEDLKVLAETDSAATQQRRPSSGGGGGGGGGSAAKPETPPAEEAPGADVQLPYADVKPADWYYTAAQYVYAKGLMSGTHADRFSPDVPTTRGMIVAILHRLENAPAAGQAQFPDVPSHQYYAGPIAWAVANGIVSGYPDGTFAPEKPISREQLASILYRYAAYKGYDTAARADLSVFADRGALNDYAVEAMAWAGGAGLVNGISAAALDPQGSATRAQTAAILMRLCETVAKS